MSATPGGFDQEHRLRVRGGRPRVGRRIVVTTFGRASVSRGRSSGRIQATLSA
jgi:hypothetical protein